jgi:hypothetical protein
VIGKARPIACCDSSWRNPRAIRRSNTGALFQRWLAGVARSADRTGDLSGHRLETAFGTLNSSAPGLNGELRHAADELRSFLHRVAADYDPTLPMSSPARRLLRNARLVLEPLLPPGLVVIGRGGITRPTITPWVGFRDPDETPSWNEGVYPIYIWSADRESLFLVLQQGVEMLRDELGTGTRLRQMLRQEAAKVRRHMEEAFGAFPSDDVNLGSESRHWRQRAYEAGAIATKAYHANALPQADSLLEDLRLFARLYEEADAARRELALLEGGVSVGVVATRAAVKSNIAPANERTDEQILIDFTPKSDAEYIAHVEGRVFVKSRRHERLIAEYGDWVQSRGFIATTATHPRDLVLIKNGHRWLVEAKVIRRGSASSAVRAAIAQLLEYRYFLHGSDPALSLVALFSEEIGPAYLGLLDSMNIRAVWRAYDRRWTGSETALSDSLAD